LAGEAANAAAQKAMAIKLVRANFMKISPKRPCRTFRIVFAAVQQGEAGILARVWPRRA
jgi:hypothetical protein